ncbi:MAG: KpsF/GutQ family sugar-phosphate isomerase [Alphaproteobacteria bacterium]|nr:KpsF/GutQ family sugar-phosphate isomerase [Alphaproteobacteria bacterium]
MMTQNVEKITAPRDGKADLESGKRTIQTEMEGLKALADSLDDNFASAVEAIHKMKEERRGRLIVAGIGKSGHVAKKLVATLASTGTPSHFVHPGEASHGDLGMVTEHDVVLVISNSGENPELSDLMRYTRRFGITMIGLTSKPDSALAQHSDILLLMPKMPEACPNGLAPTTSTTMTMALGDALAIALLERMQLTPEQFGVFHPGGKLGKRLINVEEVMHSLEDVPIMNTQGTMDQAILLLTSHNLGCVIISDDGKSLEGVITDGDLKRHMAADLLERPVKDIMSRTPKTIEVSALAAKAVNVMTKTPGQYITSLVVLDAQGRLAGLIRLQDCLQMGVA